MEAPKAPLELQSAVDKLTSPNRDVAPNRRRFDLPPVALLGISAVMLRNLSFGVLANAIAPALEAMVALIEERIGPELEKAAKTGRAYTFEDWLAAFAFEPFSDVQPAIWQPFRRALLALPGEGEIAIFRGDIVSHGGNVGMLLWLVLQAIFDAVDGEKLTPTDLEANNRWLAEIVPADWVPSELHWHAHQRAAVGVVLAYLYNEARKNWRHLSEPATGRYDLTGRFLGSSPD